MYYSIPEGLKHDVQFQRSIIQIEIDNSIRGYVYSQSIFSILDGALREFIGCISFRLVLRTDMSGKTLNKRII